MVTGAGVATVNRLPVLLCRATILRIAFPTLCFNKSSIRSSEMSVRVMPFGRSRDFSTEFRVQNNCWPVYRRPFASDRSCRDGCSHDKLA